MIDPKRSHSTFPRLILFSVALASLMTFSGCDLIVPTQALPPTATATTTTSPTPTTDWFPATPTPTLLLLPSPTPQPTREGALEGLTELLVEDSFTDDSLWQTPQGASGNVAFGVQNLTLAVARPSTQLFSLSEHETPENFALEITLQTSICEQDDQSGIVFWHQSNNDFYRLLINCAGEIRLDLVQNGQNYVLHDWEQAAQMQVAAPAVNRLTLWVYQGRFQLFINDVFQFEEGIAADRSGKLGLFARTISGDAMTVRFCDLKIYRVELN